MQILRTGTLGFGPWVGFLVTKMCREFAIPDTGRLDAVTMDGRARNVYFGEIAGRSLDELVARCHDVTPLVRG